jgi:hypothetical protein
MNWLPIIVAGVVSSFVTWLACWWWYRRRLEALRRRLERELPTAGKSEVLEPQDSAVTAPNGARDSVEQLERELDESSAQWETPRPFLDTSPLTHVVEDGGRDTERKRQP